MTVLDRFSSEDDVPARETSTVPPSETAVQPAVAIKQRDAVLDSRLAVRVTGAAGVAESSVS